MCCLRLHLFPLVSIKIRLEISKIRDLVTHRCVWKIIHFKCEGCLYCTTAFIYIKCSFTKFKNHPELEGTHKDPLSPIPGSMQDTRITSYAWKCCPSSSCSQAGWRWELFPGEPAPVLNHSLSLWWLGTGTKNNPTQQTWCFCWKRNGNKLLKHPRLLMRLIENCGNKGRLLPTTVTAALKNSQEWIHVLFLLLITVFQLSHDGRLPAHTNDTWEGGRTKTMSGGERSWRRRCEVPRHGHTGSAERQRRAAAPVPASPVPVTPGRRTPRAAPQRRSRDRGRPARAQPLTSAGALAAPLPAARSGAHAWNQRLRADLEADERPRRVPAEGAGRGAGWRSFRAFAWVAGRPAALGELRPPVPRSASGHAAAVRRGPAGAGWVSREGRRDAWVRRGAPAAPGGLCRALSAARGAAGHGRLRPWLLATSLGPPGWDCHCRRLYRALLGRPRRPPGRPVPRSERSSLLRDSGLRDQAAPQPRLGLGFFASPGKRGGLRCPPAHRAAEPCLNSSWL